MKIKRTLTEILDFPDHMPWEDAAQLLANGEGEYVVVEGVEDEGDEEEEED
jgi:hypothetical protein